MLTNKKIVLIICIVVFQVYSCDLIAKDDPLDSAKIETGNTRSKLGEHEFITNSLVEGPFIQTLFGLSTGIGVSSNYDVPVTINGQEVKGLFGEITYGSFTVEYQHKVKDWLSFSASIYMNGRLGSQNVSLLTEGINLGTGYNFSWKFKAFESKKLMIAPSLTISNQSITEFNMYEFVEKIVQNGGITADNKLVKTTNITAGLIGVKAAYALSKTFGCIGKMSAGYGESVTSVNKEYYDAGISFDADLNPKLGVPIGLALGYEWNNFSQNDVSITNPQNVLFKIIYTGRKDFDLGIEMNAQFYNLAILEQDVNMEVFFVRAGILYYF